MGKKVGALSKKHGKAAKKKKKEAHESLLREILEGKFGRWRYQNRPTKTPPNSHEEKVISLFWLHTKLTEKLGSSCFTKINQKNCFTEDRGTSMTHYYYSLNAVETPASTNGFAAIGTDKAPQPPPSLSLPRSSSDDREFGMEFLM